MSWGLLEVSGRWNRCFDNDFIDFDGCGSLCGTCAKLPEKWLHPGKAKKALRLSAQTEEVTG